MRQHNPIKSPIGEDLTNDKDLMEVEVWLTHEQYYKKPKIVKTSISLEEYIPFKVLIDRKK